MKTPKTTATTLFVFIFLNFRGRHFDSFLQILNLVLLYLI
jgi:hypothetical protein